MGSQATYGYSISKAAVMHLSCNLVVELGPRNILVNTITLGLFPSEKTQDRMDDIGGIAKFAGEVPNGIVGRPEDIAVRWSFFQVVDPFKSIAQRLSRTAVTFIRETCLIQRYSQI